MHRVVGFADAKSLRKHFGKHGHEFGAATKEIYQAMAKAFLEVDLAVNPHILECTDSSGDLYRYNPNTQEFAVLKPNGDIKTYFKPTSISNAPPFHPRDQMHRFASNLDFFNDRCGR